MKTISLLMLALLSGAAGAQTTSYEYSCKPGSGKCPIPPVPPVPPMSPMPPMPPMPAAPPAPPAPPPAPVIPDIPAGAHAACAGKSTGATLTWVIRKGETMRGSCEKEDGRMQFNLRSYSLSD